MRKSLKACSVTEICLKVFIATTLFLTAATILIAAGVFAQVIEAIVGGMFGGNGGANEAAGSIEISGPVLGACIAMFIMSPIVLIFGLIFSCVTLKELKTVKTKKELKALAVWDIIFFNPIIGIKILATSNDEFNIIEKPKKE